MCLHILGRLRKNTGRLTIRLRPFGGHGVKPSAAGLGPRLGKWLRNPYVWLVRGEQRLDQKTLAHSISRLLATQQPVFLPFACLTTTFLASACSCRPLFSYSSTLLPFYEPSSPLNGKATFVNKVHRKITCCFFSPAIVSVLRAR